MRCRLVTPDSRTDRDEYVAQIDAYHEREDHVHVVEDTGTDDEAYLAQLKSYADAYVSMDEDDDLSIL